MYTRYLHKIFTLSVFDTVQGCIYNMYKATFSPGSIQQIMPYLLVANAITFVFWKSPVFSRIVSKKRKIILPRTEWQAGQYKI
jgi:hypothetical protein